MIIESRILFFPRPDFLEAVRGYSDEIGKPLPNIPPARFLFDPAQSDALCLRFTIAEQVTDFVFTKEAVGAALVAYCLKRKIPLQKDVEKRLEKHKDGVQLMMSSGSSTVHAMIIDDHQMTRHIIKKLLERTHIETMIEASSGESALEMLAENNIDPDVIICDMHMDGMDGIEFLRKLRSSKGSLNHNKPVLILTADKSEHLHEKVREAGGSKLLNKPISAEDLNLEISLVRGYFV
jgi:two-component system chemotaxis response regulator CheY